MLLCQNESKPRARAWHWIPCSSRAEELASNAVVGQCRWQPLPTRAEGPHDLPNLHVTFSFPRSAFCPLPLSLPFWQLARDIVQESHARDATSSARTSLRTRPISAHAMPFYLRSAFEPETLFTKALYNGHPHRNMVAILLRPWRRVMSSTAFLRSSCCSYQIHVSAPIFFRSLKFTKTICLHYRLSSQKLVVAVRLQGTATRLPRTCFSKAIDTQCSH